MWETVQNLLCVAYTYVCRIYAANGRRNGDLTIPLIWDASEKTILSIVTSGNARKNLKCAVAYAEVCDACAKICQFAYFRICDFRNAEICGKMWYADFCKMCNICCKRMIAINRYPYIVCDLWHLWSYSLQHFTDVFIYFNGKLVLCCHAINSAWSLRNAVCCCVCLLQHFTGTGSHFT